MIVYTANYGEKDHPIPTNQMTDDLEGMEFVYFTDFKKPDLDGWNVVVDNKMRSSDPRMQAKWFKLHSHELFPDQKSMWMDSHYSVKAPLNREFDATTEFSPLTLFKHYYPNVLREFSTMMRRRKMWNDQIEKQMEQYVREGFPMESLLYRGAMIVRHPEAKEFNLKWWDELHKHKHPRDQLSMPYAIWRTGVGVTVFDDADDRVFKVNKHLPHVRTLPLPT
jgi:hypothetical protein